MNINLTGKNVLIGGSSKGLGLAIAKQLAASGANVTLMARRETTLKKVVDQLDTHSKQKHQYLVINFSDFDEFRSKIEKFFKNNSIDILINNTQGPVAGSAIEKSIDDYQSAFDLLFKCAVFTSNLALPHMQKQKWGRIVNVSSISVREPLSYLALSNSLRAALVAWAKSLSIEIASDNITINNTLTGYFDTERIAEINAQKAEKMGIPETEVRSAIISSIPAKRIGRPDEYANLVCFLVSDQAGYITGTNIPIDGGFLKSY